MSKILKISIFIALLVFLGTFLVHKINLPTDDLGRHIKAGEIIWQTKSVPQINLFSYAEPTHLFINHHWLSEVIFFGLYVLTGFSGLVIFKVIILLFTFGIILYLAHKKGNWWWATIFGFLGVLIILERTDVRPEIFSYFLVALYWLIFNAYNRGQKKIIWWLVPLQFLWVNLHIYFFIGLAMILFFIIQQIVSAGWKLTKEHQKLLLVAGLVFLINLLNPNFIAGALYPFNVLKNYGYDIVENKSPFYLESLMNNPVIDYFKIWLGLMVLGIVLNHQRVKIFDFLIMVSAGFLGCFAQRNLSLVIFLTLPLICLHYQEIFNTFGQWLKAKLANYFKIISQCTLVILLLFLVLQIYANLTSQSIFATSKSLEPGLGLTKNSDSAADFFLKNKIKGPVFNNFDLGSYLDFYLYPQKRVFVDNRPEAYTPEFWQFVYIPAQNDDNWWQVFNNYYQFNVIFFGHTDNTGWGRGFLEKIINDKEWATIYLDEHAIILVKRLPVNQAVIEKFFILPTAVADKLNVYHSKNMMIDYQAKEQTEKGKRYIEKNFGIQVQGK